MIASERKALEEIREKVGAIPDPEIPVVTLADLGILRSVDFDDSGQPVVKLTPTYSGCPATEAIEADVRDLLTELGYPNASVQITLSPAWTTDWIGPDAREKLRRYGIAPPGHCVANDTKVITLIPRNQMNQSASSTSIACPQCDSAQVELISEFGSTPCKSLYRCLACREPFDYFKPY